MKILTQWLRAFIPSLPSDLTDRQLADDLTLRGIAVEGVHDLGLASSGHSNGHLFEMDITTNRVDAMNHYGIAREAATVYNLPLAPLLAESHSASSSAAQSFPVRIDPAARHLCGRFTAQVLRNVTIAPSTGRIADHFNLLGQKLISNAVDASNFTLLGMGHPTHAFDLDKIEGGIIVRLAQPGEKLRLLDGTERTLEPDDLVIADERKALSLAGVMGGFDSMITANTKNILVEAAWFDPATIRRSSRRHLLHTDASHRFERGADFNAAPVANALVSAYILQHGGRAEGALIDIIDPESASRTAARPPISLSVEQVQRHLGTTLDDTPGHSALNADLILQYLTALGCTLEPTSPANFSVRLPSWRLDLEREIDLIEEIARVFSYNRFANTLPTAMPVLAHPTAAAEAAVRTRLLALGFSEAVSSTFASPSDACLFAPVIPAIPMENPLSEEASLLRPSLLPGMATMLAHNLNRDVRTVRLFEQGQTFTGTTSAVIETPTLALGLTASTARATALHNAQHAPVFELKGVIESLLSLFTLPGGPKALTFSTDLLPPWIEPSCGASALLNGAALAHFGELAAAPSQERKLRQPIFLAHLDLATLYALPLRKVTARDLSRFQSVERDFSFTLPEATQWHQIASALHALALPELQSLEPVEVYRDPKKNPGVYSLLLRTVFQSHDRTLRDDELTAWSARIIDTVTALGGILRG